MYIFPSAAARTLLNALSRITSYNVCYTKLLRIKLRAQDIETFAKIVGSDYVRTDDYARLSVAYGKTMYDVLRLRNKIVENVPDAVLYLV